MEFKLNHALPASQTTDCVVIGVFEAEPVQLGSSLPETTQTYLNKILAHADINGKIGQSLMLYAVPGMSCERVLLIGCGKQDELCDNKYKKILNAAATALRGIQAKTASVYLSQLSISNRDGLYALRAAIEAIEYQFYQFNQFKSESKPLTLAQVLLSFDPSLELQAAERTLKIAMAIGSAVNDCRSLGTLPSNICTPSYMAEQALTLTKALPKLTAKILDEDQMQALGMNCLLAVGRGSHEPSKLIELHYNGGAQDQAPIVLVGKGVTFDSGGICIKPSAGMMDMKMDMSGAATMFSVIKAAAALELPLNLIALLPCVENMPGSKAFKPGDVLKSLSGKFIEIIDTDAEGRLILADALSYAQRFNPQKIIDAATLTGAVVVALGYHHTGILSNDDALSEALLSAGKQAQDLAWRLPINEDYQAQIDSKIADMANLGVDRTAGTITAACFLARFVDKIPWAHLDIAGTAMQKNANSGRPVALLMQYLLDCSQ